MLGLEALRRLGAVMVVDADERLCGVVTAEQLGRAVSAAAGALSGRRRARRRRSPADIESRKRRSRPTESAPIARKEPQKCPHTTS